MYGSQYDRAGQVSRDALKAAEASGDPQALLDALRARQLACSAPEGVAERTRLAQRMLETADKTGSAWAEMWGRLWRIDTLFETGQLRAVQRELADLDICLDRVPGPIGRWHSLHCAATLAAATGRFTEAMRLGAESLRRVQRHGAPDRVRRLLGDPGPGRHAHRVRPVRPIELFSHLPDQFKPDAVDTTRGVATVFPALTQALICLEQGDRAGAAAAYGHAGPAGPGPRPRRCGCPAGRTGCWSPSASANARTSSSWPRSSSRSAASTSRTAAGGVYLGPIELQLGLAAAALGRLDAAVPDLQAAASICDRNGARGCAVHARVELATIFAERLCPGDRDQALAVLGDVAGEAERLGMVPFSTRISQLRTQLKGAASRLSRREQEVAGLVAQGLTNKQIGQTLYVSERTAENHVQHILTKLGFSNRSQIAAWASAQSRNEYPGE